MTNLKKFITTGLFLLASTSVLADVGNDASQVQKDMQQFYAKIESMKLSNSKPELTITDSAAKKGTSFSIEGKSMSYNVNGGGCKVALDINDIVIKSERLTNLTQNAELINKTTLKNEEQKRMVGEFIAAHEHTHCDFPKNAIQVPVLNAQENQFLNSIYNSIGEYGVHETHINYRKLIDENFADAGAAVLMLKHYGSDNKDLQYVLSVIEAHRVNNTIEGDFANTIEEHFSHSVFAEISKNLDKVESLQNHEQFVSYLLEVANKGAFQAVMEKKAIGVEISFSQTDRFVDNYLRAYLINSLVGGMDLEDYKGILSDLGDTIVKQGDTSKVQDLLLKQKSGNFSPKEMDELKIEIYKTFNKAKDSSADIGDTYDGIVSKVADIHNKLQSYNTNSNNYKAPTKESILSKIKKSHEQFESGAANKTVRKIS